MSRTRPLASAWEQRAALARGETSARVLVETALAQAAEQEFGAFLSLQPDLALAEAEAADAALASGAARTTDAARSSHPDQQPPILLGLPTAHKDLVEQRGHPTTHGSRIAPPRIATQDAPIVAAVRAAGAVSIGKTQVPEFGIAAYSENDVAAPARNPHDPARTAGGSSGGTAAAIAAGVLPAAIASDGGGSIRIPAAACGLVGLKPGRGAVPADRQAERTDPARGELGPRLAVSGPIARTVRDAALFYDALLAGARPPRTTAITAVHRADELTGLRIAVSLDSPFADWTEIRFSAAALTALAAGITALEDAGHRVTSAHFAYGSDYPDAFTTVWTSGLLALPLDAAAESRLGDLARAFLERARATTPEQRAEAVAALAGFADRARRHWGAYDAVLTPALAFAAPEVGAFRALGPEGDYRLQCAWAPQTSMVNVTGLPAITVPTSAAPDDTAPAGTGTTLPMGVQLIGRSGDDVRLLQLAAQIEERLGLFPSPAATR